VKHILVLLAVLTFGAGCTRTRPVNKCMADADQIISETIRGVK
jgi:hypothetical protein